MGPLSMKPEQLLGIEQKAENVGFRFPILRH